MTGRIIAGSRGDRTGWLVGSHRLLEAGYFNLAEAGKDFLQFGHAQEHDGIRTAATRRKGDPLDTSAGLFEQLGREF